MELKVDLKLRFLDNLNSLDEFPIEFKDIDANIWKSTPIYVKLYLKSLYSYTNELEEKLQNINPEIENFKSKINSLKGLLNLNSTNSSRPPSSDSIEVKSQRAKTKKSKRKPGGQPGHKGHHRPLLHESMVNEIKNFYPSRCNCCGKPLPQNSTNHGYMKHQVSEIIPAKVKVCEYRFHKVECTGCNTKSLAPWREEIPRSSFASSVKAYVSVLTGSYGLSKLQTQKFFKDFFSMKISTASIIALENKMSNSIKDYIEKIREAIRNSEVLYIDETSWTVANKKAWLWTFVSDNSIFYHITAKRNRKALKEVIGEDFKGIIITDRYSVYDFFPNERRAVCWAHLKRDFKRFSEMEGVKGIFGKYLLDVTSNVFELWKKFINEKITRNELKTRVNSYIPYTDSILKQAADDEDKKLSGFAKKLRKLGTALWSFSILNKVEPTNNAAERALRRPVIFRKLSFGNKSEEGAKFISRIYSVMATCKKQKRNIFEFLSELIRKNDPMNLLPGST